MSEPVHDPEARLASIDRALWILVGFLSIGLLYVARLVLLPLVLAVLFALTLSPLVRFGRKHGISNAVTGSVLVLALSLVAVTGAYLLSGPIATFIDRVPVIMYDVNRKLTVLRVPLERMSQAGETLSKLGEGGGDSAPEVRVRDESFVFTAADSFVSIAGIALVTIMLTLFMLIYHTLIMEKIVQAVPRLSGKKVAVQTIKAVENEISRYLLAISIVNVGLGVVITLAMWVLGMPTPYLWGLMAAVLNFIPYLGAIFGAVVVGLVALVSFESVGQALIVPVVYIVVNGIEGQLVTPAVVGNRLSINPLVIVISVTFWAWMWGIAGMLVAVPILIVARILSEYLPAFSGLGHAITTSTPIAKPAEAEAAAAPEAETS